MDKIIYMFWTGNNPITENRKQNYLKTSLVNHNFNIKLLFNEEIKKYEVKESLFHPAYEFLSETHKADYLRCYFMHFYGGGYSDIKLSTMSWDDSWSSFFKSDKLICGYREIHPEHIAEQQDKVLELHMKQNYSKIIGNCAYLVKPQTVITKEWFDEINKILDIKFDDLEKNPSKFAQDAFGIKHKDGTISKYPLRWAEICGEIFHKIIYKNLKFVDYSLPRPKTENYR